MSWRRAKTSGWAAFDEQQKQKDVLDFWVSNEPFPSLPGTTGSFERVERNFVNKHSSLKPFSSVVVPSVDFLAPVQNIKTSMHSEVDSSGVSRSMEISRKSGFGTVVKQLKVLYSWADDNLIEDIMVAAGNNFDVASSFLKAMVSDDTLEDHKDAKVLKFEDLESYGRSSHEKKDSPAQKVYEHEECCSSMKPCDNDGEVGGNAFVRPDEKLFDDRIEINAMLGQLTGVPVEPEWEEDDVYLSCRKDAIKMMRAATRHSKAATNSFLRGDHFSAQQFSLKAQEEWETANKLNAKAAREILSIRNEYNGIWRLDLHGLHASEAVQVLQERLHMIETQLYVKGSDTSGVLNGYRIATEALCTSVEQAVCKQNERWLEVITGRGNHSRGGAALPSAVRTFLVDNGYKIDEARPGAIMVRPKFHSS